MTTARSGKIAPKGMGLNDFVAMKEGYFAAEGLDVEFDWKTFRGTQSSWKEFDYFQRPQDKPYTESKDDVIQGACVWGTICNASAGMGKVVANAYGDSPWAIFVRPDSKIRKPEDLKDVPVSVGLRAGSHFNVPYRLERYLPLWKMAVPAEFENRHPWDFSKFGRGERFVYKPIPEQEFHDTMDQVKRWGLDQYLKEHKFENLVAQAG